MAENVPNGLCAHTNPEGICTKLLFSLAQIHFSQKLTAQQRCRARINDHVVFIIDDPLQSARRHVQHEADPARHGFVEPDVCHWNRQFNVAHALTAHSAQGDLDAAAVADHAFVFDALVLAAGTLPVPGGTKNTLAKQTALFRFEGPVIDGFWVLDFTGAPGANALWRSDANGHGVKVLAFRSLSEDFFQAFVSVHKGCVCWGCWV